MPLGISNGVLNQKNAPAIYEDIFANRPAAGFSGRIFISTDTSQIFVDNGSSWVLIANTGIGSTGNLQVVTTNGNTTNTGISITAGGLATNSAQITGLTQDGGVLFTDGTGNLAQDVNFNWDSTNNYLGIGQTGTPTAPLDIHNGTVGVQIQLNATSTNNSTIAFQNANVGKWRVGNLYSSGSNLFHIYNNTTASNALTISAANAATFIDSLTASSLIKSGGTSSQFLKADGSVDSSSYITLSSLSATTPLSYNSGTGAFTILQAGASQSGYLSSTDWNTFNNKASLAAFSASSPLSYNSGTGAFSIQVANSGQNGYLTSTDWNTFNNKQSTLTLGNLTETVSSVLTIAGGTNAVVGTGTTIQIKQSSATQNGYLSSTDWTTFNNKQAALSNPITGTGTSGYVPRFNGTTTLTNSIIQDNGSALTIGGSVLATSFSGNDNTSLTAIANGTNGTILTLNSAGTGGVIKLQTNNVDRIYINSSNYVGIGTSSPTSTLTIARVAGVASINANSANGGNLIMDSYTGGDVYLNNYNNGNVILATGGGKVGINTSTPVETLTVSGSGRFTGQATDFSSGSRGVNIDITNASGLARIYAVSGSGIAGDLALGTNNAERMRVTVGGQVLVNGSTSSNGQGQLQNTGQTFTGGLGIGGLTFSTNTTATVNTSFYFFNGGAGVTLTLPDTNGQSMIYYIKNYSASPLTIGRTGSNTFVAAGTITTVTSLTLATGVSTTIIGNGTSNYIQIQ